VRGGFSGRATRQLYGSMFVRVGVRCCCVQKGDKLEVSERRKLVLPSRITKAVALRNQRQDPLYNIHRSFSQQTPEHSSQSRISTYTDSVHGTDSHRAAKIRSSDVLQRRLTWASVLTHFQFYLSRPTVRLTIVAGHWCDQSFEGMPSTLHSSLYFSIEVL